MQLKFTLILILACSTAVTTADERNSLCELSLLRAQILAANLQDRTRGRLASVSNFVEGRAEEIDSSLVRDDVVSLGSGPDIYLPLYLYPLAKRFHMVDMMGGWGSGPDDITSEITARLKSIPGSEVERLTPKTWRVTWIDIDLGPQEKYFYLHPMNFNDVAFKRLIAGFKSLDGVVITGISPSLETRQFLLQRLKRGGVMWIEMLYRNNKGEAPSHLPEDEAILDLLSSQYRVVDHGLFDGGFRFNPHKFEIRPR